MRERRGETTIEGKERLKLVDNIERGGYEWTKERLRTGAVSDNSAKRDLSTVKYHVRLKWIYVWYFPTFSDAFI